MFDQRAIVHEQREECHHESQHHYKHDHSELNELPCHTKDHLHSKREKVMTQKNIIVPGIRKLRVWFLNFPPEIYYYVVVAFFMGRLF